MAKSLLAGQGAATSNILHLISLSADFPASVRAGGVARRIAGLIGPHWQISQELWKISSLKAGGGILQGMTREAAEADVIIIAISSLAEPEHTLFEWLDSLAAYKASRPSGLFIGLLGDEQTKAAQLRGTVKPLAQCARQAGRDFIWHCMGEPLPEEVEWLKDSVEIMLANKAAEMAP